MIDEPLGRHPIHLFNGFMNPFGGSESETLSLYALLRSKAEVHLWATSSRASRELMAQFPIRKVAPHTFRFPRGGTYVFFGAHWRNKLWPYLIPSPNRLIYVFNTFHPKIAGLTRNIPALLGWPNPDYVFISEFQKRLLGMGGVVHPSPINIDRFLPKCAGNNEPLVVGRLSRDALDKHHEEDVRIYQELAHDGFEIRIQGGTCLEHKFPADDRIRLFPEGHLPAERFLSELDVFYYRTGTFVETFGRVVFEAMACALPVVCHYHGGYADHIKHGENGFLFETTGEARQILRKLKADAALRARVGGRARKTVEELFSKEALESRLGFYLE